MEITQSDLDFLESKLKESIDAKIKTLKTELINDAKAIIESYQRSDKTTTRLSDSLEKIRQEVIKAVRSSISLQNSTLKQKQEKEINHVSSVVSQSIREKLQKLKQELDELTKKSNEVEQASKLESQISKSLDEIDISTINLQEQIKSFLNSIQREKEDLLKKRKDISLKKSQLEEEERKVKRLEAEVEAFEHSLDDEKHFLQEQTQIYLKQNSQKNRSVDAETNDQILKELQSIKSNLGSNLMSEASSVLNALKKEIEGLSQERERFRATREIMMKSSSPYDYTLPPKSFHIND